MAITTGPLFSMTARGAIGKSIVYSTWKGRKTARAYVIPANPKTGAQMAVRGTFQWVHDAYKNMPSEVQAAWIAKGAQASVTGPNAWQSVNQKLLKASTDAHEIQFICELNGGPAAGAPACTPASSSIAATLTAPAVPIGWTITQAIFVCLKSVTPSGEDEAMIVFSGTKTATPWTFNFTGLTAATKYIVGGAFQFARSPSVNAYGVSSNTIANTP